MAIYNINIYNYEQDKQCWTLLTKMDVDAKEIVSITTGGVSKNFGQLYNLKLLKSKDNTTTVFCINKDDADLLKANIKN